MKLEKKCEYCSESFKVNRNKQIGRFCSSLCNRKVLRKNQLKRRELYLLNETEQEKLDWLKRHYERFVVKNDNKCWGWIGSKSHGYASFNHRGKIMKAHRVSWIIHNDSIPESMFVLHKCDVRDCSNPEHLFLGNQTDNMKDMSFKRRTFVLLGEKNKASVLTNHNVIEIKKLLKMGVSMIRIAKDFKVNKNTIANIKNGITWKHVS